MTLITDNRELINEWTVESIYGFLKSPEWLEAFCKRHPEYNPDDASCDILDHILSDEDEIRDILEEDNRLWSVEYIQERNYDYFLIREWEKVE
jgi:hypothetical protein